MEQDDQSKSLCSNCLHFKTCAYYRSQTQPVIFCEEFACEGSQNWSPDASAFENKNKCEALSVDHGLCINCSNAAHCAFKKPNTPVYYCNEYK